MAKLSVEKLDVDSDVRTRVVAIAWLYERHWSILPVTFLDSRIESAEGSKGACVPIY